MELFIASTNDLYIPSLQHQEHRLTRTRIKIPPVLKVKYNDFLTLSKDLILCVTASTVWNFRLSVAASHHSHGESPQSVGGPADVTQVHCSIYNVAPNHVSGVGEYSVMARQYPGSTAGGCVCRRGGAYIWHCCAVSEPQMLDIIKSWLAWCVTSTWCNVSQPCNGAALFICKWTLSLENETTQLIVIKHTRVCGVC